MEETQQVKNNLKIIEKYCLISISSGFLLFILTLNYREFLVNRFNNFLSFLFLLIIFLIFLGFIILIITYLINNSAKKLTNNIEKSAIHREIGKDISITIFHLLVIIISYFMFSKITFLYFLNGNIFLAVISLILFSYLFFLLRNYKKIRYIILSLLIILFITGYYFPDKTEAPLPL